MNSPLDLLVSSFLERHPRDAARVFEELGAVRAASVLESVDADTAAPVVAEMAPAGAAACLVVMDPARGGAVLERVPVAQSVSILLPLGDPERERLLRSVSAEHASGVRDRLRFPAETAGRLMEAARCVLSAESSTDRALESMRENRSQCVYVVDGDQRLLGTVSLRDAESGGPLADLIDRRPASLVANMSLDAVRAHQAWEDVDELPVVDRRGRLLGVLRHRQVRRARTSVEAPSSSQSAGIDALVSLGEAYCSGLWEVIGPLTSPDGGRRRGPATDRPARPSRNDSRREGKS